MSQHAHLPTHTCPLPPPPLMQHGVHKAGSAAPLCVCRVPGLECGEHSGTTGRCLTPGWVGGLVRGCLGGCLTPGWVGRWVGAWVPGWVPGCLPGGWSGRWLAGSPWAHLECEEHSGAAGGYLAVAAWLGGWVRPLGWMACWGLGWAGGCDGLLGFRVGGCDGLLEFRLGGWV